MAEQEVCPREHAFAYGWLAAAVRGFLAEGKPDQDGLQRALATMDEAVEAYERQHEPEGTTATDATQ